MQPALESVIIGAASGVVTYFASIRMLGYTSAIAMPRGFSPDLWNVVVVFGLGSALVAFIIHYFALRAFNIRSFPSFVAFVVVVVAALTIDGLLATGGNAIIAWIFGAWLASLVTGRRRPKNRLNPKLSCGLDESRP